MTELVSAFIESIQGYARQCRELEKQHHEWLLETAIGVFEKSMKNELDDELSDELQEVIISCYFLVTWCSIPSFVVSFCISSQLMKLYFL